MDLNNRTVLIRGARRLLTLRGPRGPRRGAALNELEIIHDGSVLVRDGLIAEVGPTRRVENLALSRHAVEIDATGCVVMPGFVDAHTHLAFPLPAAGDSDETGALAFHSVTRKRLESRLRSYLDAMARHGTTTLGCDTGCGPDEPAELKVLRALASFDAAPLHVVPTLLVRLGLGQTAAAAVAFFEELIAKAHRRQLARFVGLDWQDNPALRAAAPALVETAHALGIPLTFHDQAPVPSDGGRLAAGFGAATVSHLDCAGQEDVDALAASGTIATLAPTDAFHQAATAHAPARALIDAGVAVALGTNFNPLHTPTLSMQAAVALACSRFRFTPAEALTAATINSAHALRCADRVGSLECGKAADIVILETSDHRDLAHHFGYNLVARTIKGGRLIASQSPVDSGQAPPRTHSVDGDD